MVVRVRGVAEMFKTIKRTEGISTTDLVGRMLLMNRAHHVRPPKGIDEHTAAAVGGQRLRERAMSVDVDDDMLAEVCVWGGGVALLHGVWRGCQCCEAMVPAAHFPRTCMVHMDCPRSLRPSVPPCHRPASPTSCPPPAASSSSRRVARPSPPTALCTWPAPGTCSTPGTWRCVSGAGPLGMRAMRGSGCHRRGPAAREFTRSTR